MVDETTLEEDLSQQIGLVTQAYSLYVDGELVGATPYEGALEELLSQLQSSTADENTISCEFAEDVEIKQEYVPTEKVMNLGYLAELLYSTKTAETTYTVKAGDTWSEIAEDHGMTSKELLALNPGYNIDKIQIGEVLTLSEAVPYLTVTVKQREYYVEDVMYDVEYTDSAYLYKGDYQVTSPGEYGAADVVANVTYVNGVETERTILSSVTLKEPVTEQRLQGTKERPTWLPTGTFRWPISGRITSRFGGRSSPGGIGSTNHQGIDIAGPYGTPVYAADGGTVTYSGWMGGYGYLVEINHGNGLCDPVRSQQQPDGLRGRPRLQGPADRTGGLHRQLHRQSLPLRGPLQRRGPQPAELSSLSSISEPPAEKPGACFVRMPGPLDRGPLLRRAAGAALYQPGAISLWVTSPGPPESISSSSSRTALSARAPVGWARVLRRIFGREAYSISS